MSLPLDPLLDQPIPTDVDAYQLTDVSIGGLESPVRIGLEIPTSGEEVTPMSKALAPGLLGDALGHTFTSLTLHCA